MNPARFIKKFVKGAANRREVFGFDWYVPDGTMWAVINHEAFLNSEIMSGSGHFIDVGAHIGRWTVPASRVYQSVTAFEPTPSINRVLRINVAINRCNNVHVHQAAVSDSEGWFPFWIYDKQGGANSFLPSHLGLCGMSKVKVRTITLDRIASADCIKIDAEGWEYHVLLGALKHLERKTKLLVEIHDEKNRNPILSLLKDYDYHRILDYPISGYPNISTLVAE